MTTPYTPGFVSTHDRDRLAAAAPALLAALERLLSYAEDCATDRDERPSCLDAARAAITKATGVEA